MKQRPKLSAILFLASFLTTACGALQPSAFQANKGGGTAPVLQGKEDSENSETPSMGTDVPGLPLRDDTKIADFPAAAPSSPAEFGTTTDDATSSTTDKKSEKTSAPVAAAGDPKSPKSDPALATDCFVRRDINFIRDALLFDADGDDGPFSKDEAKPTPLALPKGVFGGPFLVKAEHPRNTYVDPWEWVWTDHLRGYVRLIVFPPFGGTPRYVDAEITDTNVEGYPAYPKGMKFVRSNVVFADVTPESGSTIRIYYYHASGIGVKEKDECVGSIRQPPDHSPTLKPYTDAVRDDFEKLISSSSDVGGGVTVRPVHLIGVLSLPVTKMDLKEGVRVDVPHPDWIDKSP